MRVVTEAMNFIAVFFVRGSQRLELLASSLSAVVEKNQQNERATCGNRNLS